MNTRLQPRPVPRPTASAAPPPAQPAPQPPHSGHGGGARLVLPLVGLLAAASLPLGRVFFGWGFLRPVLSAVLIAVGLSWGCRRLRAGPVVALVVSVLGWAAFVGAAFLGGTTVLGIVPTAASVDAFRQMWVHGFELIGTRPAPTFAEPSLLLVTVTGVWALTHAVDGIAFRLGSPAKAILPAMGLWLVPLLLTVGEGSPAAWTVPFVLAAALLVLVATTTDAGSWGDELAAPGPSRRAGARTALLLPALLIAGVATGIGVLAASTLPGYDEPPWYELNALGGTTLTTNPIVSIRPSLVAEDTGPVMEVTTDRPVYLRTTSLDVYSDNGEWTNDGIRGTPVPATGGRIPPSEFPAIGTTVDVEVVVRNLPEAVLVPAPYEPRAVSGEAARGFQFDPRLATLTTERDTTLEAGDVYRVSAAVPDPPSEAVSAPRAEPDPAHVDLPGNVPQEVRDLARRIVAEAGAEAPLEQALAIQDELRTWDYSLDPGPGHSGDAMVDFITTQVGYCEQYAGTMAVMLRSLGIPARVGVGFTPGEQGADGVYVITNANAHAWVEVLSPGYGWLAFEPTPRQDGNVLTPTAETLVPESTVREQSAAEPVDVPATVPDEEFVPPEDQPDMSAPDVEQPAGSDAGEGDAAGPGRGVLVALAALAGVGVLAGIAWRRRRAAAPRTALVRVLDVRDEVGRIGRGLGLAAAPSETDLEYLERLAGVTPAPAAPSTAVALADRVALARYAPAVPDAVADEAEAAGRALQGYLLAGRSTPGRAAVRTRGTASAVVDRLLAAVRRVTGRLGVR